MPLPETAGSGLPWNGLSTKVSDSFFLARAPPSPPR
jgi:hypothetical protein